MEDNVFTVKLLLAGAAAAGTTIWGWFGWLVLLWAASMAMDYLTGSLAAIRHHEWSSAVAREGLWHKGGMILVVLVAALTDLAVSLLLGAGVVNAPFGHSVLLSALSLAWYTLTELGSTLENATRLTNRVPPWLTRWLRRAADTVGSAAGGGGTDDGRSA